MSVQNFIQIGSLVFKLQPQFIKNPDFLYTDNEILSVVAAIFVLAVTISAVVSFFVNNTTYGHRNKNTTPLSINVSLFLNTNHKQPHQLIIPTTCHP